MEYRIGIVGSTPDYPNFPEYPASKIIVLKKRVITPKYVTRGLKVEGNGMIIGYEEQNRVFRQYARLPKLR